MPQSIFLQSLLDKAHADIVSKAEEINVLKGEYDALKVVLESVTHRISELSNEKSTYQDTIQNLKTDKESLERKCQQLQALMEEQNLLIQESDIEKTKLKKDLDSVKALSRKLLNDLKARADIKAESDGIVDSISSKSANKKKKSKVSQSSGVSGNLESAANEQIQSMREELSVMVLEKEAHAQAEDQMIRDLQGQIKTLKDRLQACSFDADSLTQQYVCAVALSSEQTQRINALTEEVSSLATYRNAELKKYEDVVATMKATYNTTLTALRHDHLKEIANLTKEVRRLEIANVCTVNASCDESGHDHDMSLEISQSSANSTDKSSSPSEVNELSIDALRAALSAAIGERNRFQRELSACEADKAEIVRAFQNFKSDVGDQEHSVGVEYSLALSKLQKRLVETEDLLLAEKSNVRALENSLAKCQRTVRESTEELVVFERMRQKAESRADTEIKKAELSERRRKECEEELDIARAKIDSKFDEINSLIDEIREAKTQIWANEKEIARLNEELSGVVADRDKAQEACRGQENTILDLQNELAARKSVYEQLEVERKLAEDAAKSASEALSRMHCAVEAAKRSQEAEEQIRAENSQCTEELFELSEAFVMRGNLIKDLERRYDVALSDISFLKMDTTVRATRISQLEEEITELKRQYAQALAKIEGLQTQIVELESDIDSAKQQVGDKTGEVQSLRKSLEQAISSKGDFDELHASHKDLQMKYLQLKTSHGTVSGELKEALVTMEELSMTAAEEIESREKQIVSIQEELKINKDVAYEYEKLSLAYETLVHQYAEIVEERQQLFNVYAEARNEIAVIKAQMTE